MLCAAGLAASLATPALAVSHGHAHRALTEQQAIAAHAATHNAAHAGAAHSTASPRASSTDHDADHPHGAIEQGVTTRSHTVAPAVISAVADVVAASFTSAVVGECSAREAPPRCWAERPPSAPRAPPTVS